jgi:hypothetical protein
MDKDTQYRLEKGITRAIAGLCVASLECFAFALLDTWTGVLRGTTLLTGQWVAMLITFGLIAAGAWYASGAIVQAIESADNETTVFGATRRPAFAAEVEQFTVVNSLGETPRPASRNGARSERVRRIERMVQP